MAAIIAFSSTSSVVLSGLTAAGATPRQAASGVLVMCLACGFAGLLLSFMFRIPVTLAWSTPGAAMLVGGTLGWPTAVGGFVVAAALTVLAGAWPLLGQLIRAIPGPLAHAMLAGLLFPLCAHVLTYAGTNPLTVGPLVIIWALAQRWKPALAAPSTFMAAVAILGVQLAHSGQIVSRPDVTPALVFQAPAWSLAGIVGVGLPLFVVTMASQNIPGIAVMKSFGYDVPWRPAILTTGLATLALATFGAHAINLAAIGASFSAAPEAHPDPRKRWVSAASTGATFILLGLVGSVIAGWLVADTAHLIATVAGLALIGTLVSSLAAATADETLRVPAGVTLVASASGAVLFSVSSSFWGLVAGIAVMVVLRRRQHAPDDVARRA